MSKAILSPSILSADFSDLSSSIRMIENGNAGAVHIDVMDGHFVPPVSFGQTVIKTIRKCTKLPFDVHLMIEKPESQIESFIEAGADWITFHQEATSHADLCIQKIHSMGKKAGIAINPATSLAVLDQILPLVDLVLVMTVNPGWGGQALIPYTLEKVSELVKIRSERKLNFKISVDGGVNPKTLPQVLEAGTDIFVSGSSFFKGEIKWEK